MSTSITFSGLASGLDTKSIIDALVTVARQPIDRLTTQKASYSSQLSKLSDLSSKLSTLRSAAQALDSSREFKSFTASSSDSDKLTVAAGSSAVPGTYAVNVQQLAQAQRTYSKAFTDNDTALPSEIGTGTLGLRVGTADWQYVDVTTTDTLQTIANKINDKNAGVNAAVIKYSDTEYRLMLNGTSTGAASTVEFNQPAGLTLDLTTAAGDEARDAELVLGGQASVIKRSTNQITDAIPGVTLNLLAETDPSLVTVTVASDPDAIATKVSAFVTAYNNVANLIHDELTYDGEVRTDSLMGDATLRQVKSQLQTVITSKISGASTKYDGLSQIGISTNRDGTLSLDSSKLKEALGEDFEGVARLFTMATDGAAVHMADVIDHAVRSNDGLISVRQSGIQKSMDFIDERVARLETNVESYTTGLQRQFTALESLMSSIQNQSSYLSQISS
jgi:flagellar hook-associated protein 2